MKNIGEKAFRKYSKLVLGGLLVLTLFFVYQASRVELDYDFEKFYPTSDPETEFFLEYRQKFQSDNDFLLLAIQRDKGVFDKDFLNKIDKLDDDVAEDLQYEAAMMDDYSVAISSISGEGMTDLVSTIEDAMMGLLVPIEVILPYTHGKEVNLVQEVGHVEELEYRDDGTYLLARVPEAVANRLTSFSINEEAEDEMKHGDDEIDWVAIGRGRHAKKQEM